MSPLVQEPDVYIAALPSARVDKARVVPLAPVRVMTLLTGDRHSGGVREAVGVRVADTVTLLVAVAVPDSVGVRVTEGVMLPDGVSDDVVEEEALLVAETLPDCEGDGVTEEEALRDAVAVLEGEVDGVKETVAVQVAVGDVESVGDGVAEVVMLPVGVLEMCAAISQHDPARYDVQSASLPVVSWQSSLWVTPSLFGSPLAQ